LVPATISFDTIGLNPSSIRFEMAGDDLLRASHILCWGLDGAGAVVPLTVDADLPNLSTDAGEGATSVPLTLADSGDDSTPFVEVYLYVALTSDPNAMTNQPVSFRLERADETLIRSSGLDDFQELDNSEDRSARIWRLVETEVATRVDATGPLVPILRVDGPDNAMIRSVVAFGVNRDGPRPGCRAARAPHAGRGRHQPLGRDEHLTGGARDGASAVRGRSAAMTIPRPAYIPRS